MAFNLLPSIANPLSRESWRSTLVGPSCPIASGALRSAAFRSGRGRRFAPRRTAGSGGRVGHEPPRVCMTCGSRSAPWRPQGAARTSAPLVADAEPQVGEDGAQVNLIQRPGSAIPHERWDYAASLRLQACRGGESALSWSRRGSVYVRALSRVGGCPLAENRCRSSAQRTSAGSR